MNKSDTKLITLVEFQTEVWLQVKQALVVEI